MSGETGRNKWLEVRESMGHETAVFGPHVSYWLRRSPRRLLHSMSYYKFAAKLIGPGKRVLEAGCAEGLGTWLLAKECGQALGLDTDQEAVACASSLWKSPLVDFQCRDILADCSGLSATPPFGAFVSFDVIEHIPGEDAESFWRAAGSCLARDGVAVVGTPNLEGQKYASAVSKLGHVNVYDSRRLQAEMRRHFGHVFIFAANDEVVHTGYLPMAHYLIGVGCKKLT
jgi:2-polyprenyl-3-methyl-5-hydroxy-6-metoxy-1,4-benzoquinol methylase